jgi:hypothetical protein
LKATNIASGVTHRVLPRGFKEGYPAGVAGAGHRLAVVAEDAYTMREEPPPAPPLIVVSPRGRLLQHVTVPHGWKSVDAAVYLR